MPRSCHRITGAWCARHAQACEPRDGRPENVLKTPKSRKPTPRKSNTDVNTGSHPPGNTTYSRSVLNGVDAEDCLSPPPAYLSSQVHGTCLGMETLAVILSGNYSILTSFDAENSPVPLLFTDEADDSHLIQSLPEVVVRDLQNSPITMENHGMGEFALGLCGEWTEF